MKRINTIKSIYGFFYAGLKLGEEPEHTAESDDEENEYGVKKFSCKSKLKKFLSPITGSGIEIDYSRGIKAQKVRSWYYWEYVIYFEKIFFLATITFMNDYNEGI